MIKQLQRGKEREGNASIYILISLTYPRAGPIDHKNELVLATVIIKIIKII